MKRNIKNKVYDTETARECGTYKLNAIDPDESVIERLFRKKTGEYFLQGRGGKFTRYATIIFPNVWAVGERIIPMTYEQAQEWATEHLDAGDIACLFGTIQDDGKTGALNLHISEARVEKLRRESSRTGKPMSAIISEMIDQLPDA